MSLTFLGIENPIGVLGPKVRGVVTTAEHLSPIANVKPHSDASKYATTLNPKYNFRADNLAVKNPDIGRLMVEDTIDNRNYVLKLLKARGNYPNVRLAMCSSLNSMLKYLHNCWNANQAQQFDTVIAYGHGLPGSINMGLGKIGIGQPRTHRHENYEPRKRIREAFGLDKKSDGDKPEARRIRDLGTKNIGIWTTAFTGVRPALIESERSDYFHLFLMGCSVGDNKVSKKTGDVTQLQNAAVTALSNALGNMNVCISAPNATIDDDHLDNLLDRLPDIHGDIANRGGVYLKGKATEEIELLSAFSDD
ncbi:MAG: hypothetical protein ABWZ88_13605 [Variovorax sp.]